MSAKADTTNLPDTTSVAVAPVAAPNSQGKKKTSSHRRMEKHLDKKNSEVADPRRKALMERLDPGLSIAYDAYLQQLQQGASVDTMVPVTTRGIGFNVHQFHAEITKNLPRIEGPPKATVQQVYRVAHMQFARQMTLSVPRPKHTRAVRVPERPKVSAFATTRNGIHVADAINQFGHFKSGVHNYSTYVPELKLNHVVTTSVIRENSPDYAPTSPGPSDAQKPKTSVLQALKYSIDDPHTLTIFNMREAVQAMSNPLTPLELRNQFISRSPIPGAVYVDGLLTNPNSIMPYDYRTYVQRHFLSDLADVECLMDQVNAHMPQMVVEVSIDGKGSEINLASSFTPHSMYINDGHILYGDDDIDESYFFSTTSMGQLNRLRSYVNLMNEAPYVPVGREIFDSTFGIRDPNSAQHSMTEAWLTLAWNVCPMRKRHA